MEDLAVHGSFADKSGSASIAGSRVWSTALCPSLMVAFCHILFDPTA
ncbi:hypothetical protein SNOG_03373 [Parastagonospora nodorum SN15]|uniref:Uncharacterized protein n=1 Tax=Phaeosphaeria nodorum (strain SN15 / ATCC MYA-4574 / FGSC 10173) TaxID=321614 RepID=Q0UXZ1_PHANO|nr:hypothetical protein SNOG_03373 [Parastagonospora nodorum SN15]EAT88578.1 hypothetical protein SNOG_03373 [Parastagonospora nodorum SN15]